MEIARKENVVFEIWRVVYPIFMYYVIVIFIMIIGMFAIESIMTVSIGLRGEVVEPVLMEQNLDDVMSKYSMLVSTVAALSTLPIYLHIFNKDKKKGVTLDGTMTDTRIANYQYIYILLTGITAWFGFNYLIAISRIIEMFPSGVKDFGEVIYGSNIIITILAIVIIGPIVEEYIFRGLVYNRLRGYMNKMLAMIISALLFGIYHLDVIQGIYAFAGGVCLIIIYEKYKNIWAPILFHGAKNAMSLLNIKTGIFNKLSDSILVSTIIAIVACGLTILLLLIMNKKVQPIEKG